MKRAIAGSLLCRIAVTSGCAGLQPFAGFDEVRQTVSERSSMRVHWNTGTEADAEVNSAVASLLREELTAEQAVQLALLKNRHLQAMYEELSLAQAELVQAGLLRNPVFNAEIRFFRSGAGFELAVVQDFVDALLVPLRARLARSAFEAAKVRVAGAVFDLAGEVRAEFYRLQAAEQMREMRYTILEATSASYELRKRLHAAGNVTDLELFDERALYEQSKIDLAETEAEVLEFRERLNALMGLWGADTTWRIAPRLPQLPAEDIARVDVERRAIAQSLDLELSRHEIEIAAQRLGYARPLKILGETNLGATADGEPHGAVGVGPAFSVPMPVFDLGQAAAAGITAEWRRQQERYYALAIEIRAHARAAWNRTRAARVRAEYYAAVILPLRHNIVEETQKEYNAMLLGAFQLLAAKQQEIQAGGQYIRALRDYWLARAELEQILAGRLSRSQRSMPAPDVVDRTPVTSRDVHE